ncbi:MAG: prephenate dehydrogenase/arogenate dehydrogenase family protein [Candidatus Bathyarchaeia archaeon]
MKIAVLGAAGNMGKWLVQYFASRGHLLTVFDINRDELRMLSKNYKVKVARDNLEAVKDAELTIVSVPIDKTVKVLRDIAAKLKRKSIVVEIASIKAGIIEVLKECSNFGVQPLSLHPLFGPLKRTGKKKIALIPVLSLRNELKIAKKIFPDAEFHVVNAEKHDRLMAVTLSLPYFINMTLASTFRSENFETLMEFGGTTFTLQSILIGSIMVQSPELHASLHMANKYSIKYLKEFLFNAEKIIRIIESGSVEKFKALSNEINNSLSKSLDLEASYNKMYIALEALEKS